MASEISIPGLVAGASWPVQAVLLLLLAASVYSWYLIFAKLAELRATAGAARRFEQRFWSGVELSELYRQISERRSVTGPQCLFVAGFSEFLRLRERYDLGGEVLAESSSRAMRAAQAREIERLEARLPWLATIGSTSPYVGLLGTVWGIMNAFLAPSGARQATLAMVAPGIAEALIATAMGLFAAIPAVVAYNRFAADIEHIDSRLERFREELVNILARSGPAPAVGEQRA